MPATEAGITLDSFSSCSESGSKTYLARYDRTRTRASMAVVAVVSKVLGRDPVEIDQLHYAVDADALDDLFDDEETGNDVSVTFSYEGHEITVTADEVTAVHRSPDAGNDGRGGESASV